MSDKKLSVWTKEEVKSSTGGGVTTRVSPAGHAEGDAPKQHGGIKPDAAGESPVHHDLPPLSLWRCPRCLMQISDGAEAEIDGEWIVGHFHDDRHFAGFVPAEEVEVIPVSAPNVLSKAEAQLVRRMESAMGQFDQQEWQEAVALQDRLEDWASKERG